MAKLKDGRYAVEVKKWNGSKTWEQIKAVKGILIPKISDFTGETRKEVENRLKKNYGVTEVDEIEGEKVLILVSFSYYTKDQMTSFIEETLHHCEFDLGFIIDLETRKQLMIDEDTGELVDPMLSTIKGKFG